MSKSPEKGKPRTMSRRAAAPPSEADPAELHEFYGPAQQQAALPAIEDRKPATNQSAKPRKVRKK